MVLAATTTAPAWPALGRGITKALAALPASAWKPMTLGRAGGRTRRVTVHDDPAAHLSAYPRPIRQLAVTGLGHDQPTLLITNQAQLPARQVIESYVRRMNIEQRLAEAIQSFSLDALAGAVPLNIDLDVALFVLAHTLCTALRRRLPGYATAAPDTLRRRFLSTGGTITGHRDQITIRINRRTYSPVLSQASLPEIITVPWWEGRTLRYEGSTWVYPARAQRLGGDRRTAAEACWATSRPGAATS